MRVLRPWLWVLLCAPFLFSQTGIGPSTIRVDEARIKFVIDPAMQVELPVLNNGSAPLRALVHLEILREDDSSLESHQVEDTISVGSHALIIPWPVHFPSNSISRLYWYRLSYRISALGPGQFAEQTGVVQLGRVVPSMFRIQVSGLRHPHRGSDLRLRVHVDDPRTGRSQPHVQVQAQWSHSPEAAEQTIPPQKAVTDARGNAIVTLKVPQDSDSDPALEVSARRGGWQESKSIDVNIQDRADVMVSTDKPIYQPGQVLHMRALLLGPDHRALPGATAKVAIRDDDSNMLFAEELKTSKFGVVQADWEIPEKVKLGDYMLEVRTGDAGLGGAAVRISRYELPEFSVSSSTDKKFYLPGETPQVEVTAEYLFGQAVRRATVRLVRDNGSHWNPKKRAYETDQQEVLHGEFDSSGKFTAKIDVAGDFSYFSDASYARFKDIRFAVYVTDLSTQRTEQRHFVVRISPQPLHIYLLARDPNATGLDGFVTAAFPDGTPASVDLQVSAVQPGEDGKWPLDPRTAPKTLVTRLHTNKYGVARLRTRPVPESLQSAGGEVELLLEAQDHKHGDAFQVVEVRVDENEYLRITALNSLLRPGESVIADIESSAPNEQVVVDVLGRDRVLSSRRVMMSSGHAQVEFPYQPDFRNDLNLIAYTFGSKARHDNRVASAEVLFPELQDLNLQVSLGRTTYKPGEAASARFTVRSPEGKAAVSALGVVVYDKAVAERVRSDEEFGRYGFYFGGYEIQYEAIAGISYRDLLNQNLTAPVPPDLELLAEAILATKGQWGQYQLFFEDDDDYNKLPADVFSPFFKRRLSHAESLLLGTTAVTEQFPRTEEEVSNVLQAGGVNLEELRDPWGMPYELQFYTTGKSDVIALRSRGPDKLRSTKDDFIVFSVNHEYFGPVGRAMDHAVVDYFNRTGKYVRDLDTLTEVLRTSGIDLNTLRDPWGNPYYFNFETSGPFYRIVSFSFGPDGKKGTSDDVQEWTSTIHYFQMESALLDSSLAEHFRSTGSFPQNEQELKPILEACGLSSIVDPWGRPYHFVFSEKSRYGNQLNISEYRVYGHDDRQRMTQATPVTQQVAYIEVVSYGADNDPAKQFAVAVVSRVLAEQSSKMPAPQKTSVQNVPMLTGTGSISGVVIDPEGAVISDAVVKATHSESRQEYSTTTGSNGAYELRDLPGGEYAVLVQARGFKSSTVLAVPVTSSNVTRVDVELSVGAVAETVEVTAAAPLVETTQSAVSAPVRHGSEKPASAPEPVFTPRLRKYFPETLVWRPELLTDAAGNAQINFKMADNITTWKMSVIASNLEGQLGIAEKELQTFQPFFIDHEPPKVLTQGDQIQLPVVLRNYLKKPQTVKVNLQAAAWFSSINALEQRVEVPAGEESIASFLISADRSIHAGQERITAANGETGDAVEKLVAVHPDGEEVPQTVASLLAGPRNSLEVRIPENAIPGSLEGVLRIYPNLAAHVLDSVSAMATRPAGCAEQITSTAFASLLTLQLLRRANQDDPGIAGNPNAELARRVRKHLLEAYQELSNLQNQDGGFPYWLNTSPDVAVTAHVLDFLAQASDFIEVDSDEILRAKNFLISNQTPEGGWSMRWYGSSSKLDRNLSALVTRVLAETSKKLPDDPKHSARIRTSFINGMKFLETSITEWNDPYAIGQYALAASFSGRADYLEKARMLVAHLAHHEGSGTYWNLEANRSPFYGWGGSGRLETTGLIVRALFLMEQTDQDKELNRLAQRGLVYLLEHADRYGMWYSTQATINVLRGLVAGLPTGPDAQFPPSTADVLVNGKPAGVLHLPSSNAISGAISVDISGALQPGNNNIEVRRPDGGPAMRAQLITTHYVRWSDSTATIGNNFLSGESRALRLNVEFNSTEAKAGQNVHCSVQAERVGFAGYGMMLAEIGLPPGADVDRALLQKAVESFAISQYDILPDRVILYLWPQAGGSNFSFDFKPRFAMKAASAPSILYDYYNPESRAVVAPARFTIH